MKDRKIILVLDVGATNVRSVAVSDDGVLLAIESLKNTTSPDLYYPDGMVWDLDLVWEKLKSTTAGVLKQIDKKQLAAVTVTSFGVDGAPLTKDGDLAYPVISWQCQRTVPVMNNIDKYIPLAELYSINGLQPFSFNTINKLIWLRENRREVLDRAHRFLFFPSLILHRMTGEMVNDTSMAGTSMLTRLTDRKYSERILNAIGVNKDLFPPAAEPGTKIGHVTGKASLETGIPAGLPAVVTGHDTQFAVFGSGARENEPVLSSGTWDILMVRSRHFLTNDYTLKQKVTTELDPVPGLYNIGVQWIASGMLEWIMRMFWAAECGTNDVYEQMISLAEKVPAGSNGVTIHPSFFPEPGSNNKGAILGLLLNTPREEIYRAAVESLAYRTRQGLEVLQNAGMFRAGAAICVGGGSKNRLLNQVRADVLGIPLKLVDQKETTVLGAAMFALTAMGVYASTDEARDAMITPYHIVNPSGEKRYEDLYTQFREMTALFTGGTAHA